MFKRKNDAPEYNYLYGIPAAMFMASFLVGHMSNYPGIYQMGYLAASICCIGGIAGLASQQTARIGNALGLIGISSGLLTTLG
jgi:NAD(P) transhydrogenase